MILTKEQKTTIKALKNAMDQANTKPSQSLVNFGGFTQDEFVSKDNLLSLVNRGLIKQFVLYGETFASIYFQPTVVIPISLRILRDEI